MIEAWWNAHELEIVLSAFALGFAFVVIGISAIVGTISERRARKKYFDAELERVRSKKL